MQRNSELSYHRNHQFLQEINYIIKKEFPFFLLCLKVSHSDILSSWKLLWVKYRNEFDNFPWENFNFVVYTQNSLFVLKNP